MSKRKLGQNGYEEIGSFRSWY